MNIPFRVDPQNVTGDGILVYVRCSDEQAAGLARALRAQYPAARPRLLPLVDKQDYTHCFRVPDSEHGLRGRWPAIQFQMLIGGSAAQARTPAQASRPPAKQRLSAESIDGHHLTGAAGQAAFTTPVQTPIAAGAHESAPVHTTRPEPQAAAYAEREAAAAGAVEPLPTAAARESAAAMREEPEPPRRPEPPDPRLAYLDRLLAANDLEAVIKQVAPDEPAPAVRGRLGVALARHGAYADARGHLLVAWQWMADAVVALELARIHWRDGEYDQAASAYKMVLDEPPEALEPRDHAAIAELAVSGAFGDMAPERQLSYIETFFDEAGAQELQDPQVALLAHGGLALARQVGVSELVFHAYQHMMDVLLARHAGQGLRDLLDQMRDDYWRRLLSARDRFDLMDEMTGYLQDYPLLREPLVEDYEELLRQEIEAARAHGAFPEYAKDLYRTWRRFAHRGELGDEYRRLVAELRVAEQGATVESDADMAAASRLAGKRIALVGGHGRTREHVRARLERWGVRVDEVAPPTNGRINERDIADRIRSSDLILLIVGYMGHDMSTVVNNLVRREALTGTVRPVDCRGTSGICRAITRWAADT